MLNITLSLRHGLIRIFAVTALVMAPLATQAGRIVWPCSGSVTSAYGPRSSPCSGCSSFHYGIDIGVGVGTILGSPGNGTVTSYAYDSCAGNLYKIGYGGGWETRFLHCSAKILSVGQTTTRNESAAKSGGTGSCTTGPHLHFEVRKDGVAQSIPGSAGTYVTRGSEIPKEYSGLNDKADRIDLIAAAPGGSIQHKWFERGSTSTGWHEFESLGGSNVAGDPAISSQESGRLNLFYRGTDSALYHKYFSKASGWSNGTTGAWSNLGGTIASGPDAVSWGDGRIDVVARGNDNAVYLKSYASGAWGGWVSLGGNAVGDPAISSQESGRLNVFYRGTDNNLYHKYYSTTGGWAPNGQTGAWENLGGQLYSSPDAVSWGNGKIDVVAQGVGGAITHTWYQVGSGWAPFHSLGGAAVGDPTINSQEPGRLNVFYRGTDNALYHIYYNDEGWSNGTTGPWENLGGNLASGPDAVSW